MKQTPNTPTVVYRPEPGTLRLMGAEECCYVPGAIITAGLYVLLDKDQRVYLRSTDRECVESERDGLNAKYPHMGFVMEYHK